MTATTSTNQVAESIQSAIEPSLLSLPPELRDMIWDFSLHEPTHILASIQRRTINRDPYRTNKSTPIGKTTVRELQPAPSFPPLAFASKSLSEEVLTSYFGTNTFLSRVDKGEPDDVEAWLQSVGTQCSHLVPHKPDQVKDHITLRLQFTIPWIHPVLTIGYRNNAKLGNDEVRYGGALHDDRPCWLDG